MNPCFRKVSDEKFALETLLREINEHNDVPSIDIVERFAKKANQCFFDGQDSNNQQTFETFWNTAMSILADVNYEIG